jgi:competence ComEA-like helix-hairpin-helix protein
MISQFPKNRSWIHRVIVGSILCITAIFSSVACAKRSRSVPTAVTYLSGTQRNLTSERININTASARELEVLPGIGKGLAERIVEHRQKYGPFGRPEHLIMVRGISEKRFVAIRDLITVE